MALASSRSNLQFQTKVPANACHELDIAVVSTQDSTGTHLWPLAKSPGGAVI